jgi:hypothetical protein
VAPPYLSAAAPPPTPCYPVPYAPGMRYGIVEGEPGIFPAPVASLMRKIGGFFDRRRGRDAEPAPPGEPGRRPEEPTAGERPTAAGTTDAGTGPAAEGPPPAPPGKAAADDT